MDKWNSYYRDVTLENMGAFNYGDTITYKLGYDFLKDCETIEDWGCGTGGFKRFVKEKDNIKYIGVDGSLTPFSNVKADLTQYTSNTQGIFMRHIIEHNYDWSKILDNACKSFTKKMCLILFTPFVDVTKEIEGTVKQNTDCGVNVPDISFRKEDLINIFENYGIKYTMQTFNTSTLYNIEHIFFMEK